MIIDEQIISVRGIRVHYFVEDEGPPGFVISEGLQRSRHFEIPELLNAVFPKPIKLPEAPRRRMAAGPESAAEAAGYERALEDAADAIRAAGYEVA